MFEHRAHAMTGCRSGNNLAIENQSGSSMIYPLCLFGDGRGDISRSKESLVVSLPKNTWRSLRSPILSHSLLPRGKLQCLPALTACVFCSRAQGPPSLHALADLGGIYTLVQR